MARLLENEPFRSVQTNRQRFDRLQAGQVPVAWVRALKRHLDRENTPDRRSWWESKSASLIEDSADARIASEIRGLAACIGYFGKWSPHLDAAIFRAYLDHPAAIFKPTGKGFGTQEFLARDAARNALIRLGQPVPKDWKPTRLIVTATRTGIAAFQDIPLRFVWGIVATLALSAIPIMVWRRNARRS